MKYRKAICLTLCFALILYTITPFVHASDIPAADTSDGIISSYTVSEYDILCASSNNLQLQSIGTNTNFTVEDAILERAALPESILQTMGYSAAQIEVLKAYDGSPLVENPQLRSVLASMTGTIRTVSVSSSSITLQFQWLWDQAPAFAGTAITENVGIAFKGINPSSTEMLLNVSGWTYIGYYTGTTYKTHVYNYDLQTPDPHEFAKFVFPCGNIVDSSGIPAYCKSGTVQVQFTPAVAGNPISAVSVAFGYDHFVLGTGIGLSAALGPIGLGFDFSGSEMYYGCATAYADGRLVLY